MKISTKTRYGLRALAYIAKSNKYCSTNEVAKAENISFDYLEKIFSTLKKAKILKAQLGNQGGYALAKPIGKITAGEVMRTLEGTLAPVMCVAYEKDKHIHCERSKDCITKKIWFIVQENLLKTLNSITLDKLINNSI